ncbi:MAG: enoyl-ACP reductase FabI [Pseudomonadota bacterium]
MTTKIMQGKRGLILGLANNKSIAWGIAQQVVKAGASLALGCQGDAMRKRVEPMAQALGSDLLFDCDVNDEASLDAMFASLADQWGKLNFIVHAVAFSDKNELKGEYLNTTRQNFLQTMEISCYSFTDIARRATPLMKDGGSCLTLTYFGGEKVMPHYNVMGVAKAALDASVRYMAVDLGKRNIRVNAISAGPIKTLAASGIGDFRYILNWNKINAPLQRNVTIDDIGKSALFLLSDLSGGVTGEIHHVDCGYSTVGMTGLGAYEESAEMLNAYRQK